MVSPSCYVLRVNFSSMTDAFWRTIKPGATLCGDGVAFAVHSRPAHAVDLCLFDEQQPSREKFRLRLERGEDYCWRGFVRGLTGGALYGFRAHGPWNPARGQWFNPGKLLLDPNAKAVAGVPDWNPLMQNLMVNSSRDFRDNAHVALKSVVIRDEFYWGDDAPPNTSWCDTVIYEAHVRGFTKKHPKVPKRLRGTYAGLAHPAAIAYLGELGITAVQLLPVHLHLNDGFLIARGLTNYWGYNTLGFMAPHPEYAAARDPQEQVDEFRMMVRELHRAGIEVILDVVYNHTAEGDENGPLLSLRGLDNHGSYMLNQDARTLNYTGCGNTVNAAAPPALRIILDSLRYWVEQMHVDGFRFDLAATLGRRREQFDPDAPFFQAVANDPVLSRVKMIAEPWDMGPNGYQVGGFPAPWRELNGRYRDRVRCFWRGDDAAAASFAKRVCGSDEIFGSQGRPPHAGVNFITSHDGFTLRDLWSYNHKHNEENLEGGRDGDDQNHSWNCGVEGETTDVKIKAMRRGLVRASLATMFCSLGVPFLTMGDERWRTQRGNNNAYCQDGELSWLDWSKPDDVSAMIEFTRRMIIFRRDHPELRRSWHFTGASDPFTGRRDIDWLDENGGPMSHHKWHDPTRKFFAASIDLGVRGAMLLLFNASGSVVEFVLPAGEWRRKFDTSLEDSFEAVDSPEPARRAFASAPHSVACMLLEVEGEES